MIKENLEHTRTSIWDIAKNNNNNNNNKGTLRCKNIQIGQNEQSIK